MFALEAILPLGPLVHVFLQGLLLLCDRCALALCHFVYLLRPPYTFHAHVYGVSQGHKSE